MVNLKLNTQKNYRGILDNHIYPYIKDYHLKSIKAGTIQDLLNQEFEKDLPDKLLELLKAFWTKHSRWLCSPTSL